MASGEGLKTKNFLSKYKNHSIRNNRQLPRHSRKNRKTKTEKQKQKPKVPSFPRRRESRPPTRQESIGNNRNRTNLDSRFRGNDGGKVAVFPINSCRSSFLGWREI
ncbi:hypothetical protein DYG45_08760 [Neisseria gonorrhoeae]